MVFHPCIDGAGAIELLCQDQASQLVGQCDTPQTDAGLRGTLDAVVQPMGGADDKRHIPCAAHGTLSNHGSQVLAGHLPTLDTEGNKIRPLAHAG